MIRSGEKHVIDTLKRFKTDLNVSWEEITDLFDEETTEDILKYENEWRENDDEELIDDPAKASESLLWEFAREYIREYELITGVLENRDAEYVHLYDGYNHTIVELLRRDWDDPVTGTYGLLDNVPDEAWSDPDYVVIEQDPQGAIVRRRNTL